VIQYIILVTLLIAADLPAAEIKYKKTPRDSYGIWVEGGIEAGDYQKVVSIIRAKKKMPRYLELVNSPGGDMEEAIKIGEFVRKSLLRVMVIGKCYSACSLILIAGIDRTAIGEVGLHRPYFEREYFSKLPLDDASRKYKALEKQLEDYLQDMGSPSAIAEQMKSVQSTEIKIYEGEEFISMLGRRPSSIGEWLIARCGLLSKVEKDDWVTVVQNDYSSVIAPKDPEFRAQLAVKASRLSPGYQQYLRDKGKKIRLCEEAVLESERTQYAKTIFPEWFQ